MAPHAVEALPSAQPDVTLVLDLEGVIRNATLSTAVQDEDVDAWIGRSWPETVADPGSVKIQRLLADARRTGVSAFRQVNQRFPSGLELPIEYTAVRLGDDGLVAVGKSLQTVVELQSRLAAAQLAMERDYWRLREVETRCRVLFDTSNDAVLLVRGADLRILDANPAAIRALSPVEKPARDVAGRTFLEEIAPKERSVFEAMLHRVHDQGRAPGILARLGRGGLPWFIRASLLTTQDGAVFLLQLTPAGPSERGDPRQASVQALIERAPDGFVVLDEKGVVLRANRAFLELVQVGHETSVTGERLGRWLGRPGADMAVLLANVARHGAVRLFSTTLHGELGTGTEVEVSAAGEVDTDPPFIGVLIRDVASRLPGLPEVPTLGSARGAFDDRIGKTPLRALVKEAVGVVERGYIESALELTAGNRTAAAEILGLSRQSLYMKLNRYGLDGDGLSSASEDE